jgi:hypothetical protein
MTSRRLCRRKGKNPQRMCPGVHETHSWRATPPLDLWCLARRTPHRARASDIGMACARDSRAARVKRKHAHTQTQCGLERRKKSGRGAFSRQRERGALETLEAGGGVAYARSDVMAAGLCSSCARRKTPKHTHARALSFSLSIERARFCACARARVCETR